VTPLVVLITGCSSGIGRATAASLAAAGHTVVATARRPEELGGIDAALALPLDVTDEASIEAALGVALARYGRIDALVNNAGYAVRGAVEEVPTDQARRMFDVNLFGVMRTVQAVAPHMRHRRSGRIVNIGSVSGKLATPANGTYSASKFALEGLSDSLRLELAPFGIRVILVEPGSIGTRFHATVESNGRAIFANPESPYRPLYQTYEQVNARMRRGEPQPDLVSQVVRRAIETPRPKARYVAGFTLSGRLVMRLGDGAWDRVARQLFRI
jgi:NAD(P)-dependent dehydrogenase (short-subunit alcohol dehydrogenase family)